MPVYLHVEFRKCTPGFEPFLLLSFYLDHPHAEAGLSGQLLSDVSGGLWSGRECRLQGLQLFGFDGGSRPASFPDGALLVVLVIAHVLIGQMSRF